jgi:hypothetical protein
MSLLVTAPHPFTLADVFLAGGISGTDNWQDTAIDMLAPTDHIVVNPRRRTPMVSEGDEAAAQIAWEYNAIRKCDWVLFWFPPETLCPIALFELGATLERTSNVTIGCHPEYKRRFDVIEQVNLRRPGLFVNNTVERTVNSLIASLAQR